MKKLLETEGQVSKEELKSRRLNFMIENSFLTLTVQDLLDKVAVANTEESVDVWYSFALEKPKLTRAIP